MNPHAKFCVSSSYGLKKGQTDGQINFVNYQGPGYKRWS